MVDITFYHSLICPRCIKPRKIINELEKEYPDLSIERVGSVSRFLRRKLRTLPAIQIGNTIVYGEKITKQKIEELLQLKSRNKK